MRLNYSNIFDSNDKPRIHAFKSQLLETHEDDVICIYSLRGLTNSHMLKHITQHLLSCMGDRPESISKILDRIKFKCTK